MVTPAEAYGTVAVCLVREGRPKAQVGVPFATLGALTYVLDVDAVVGGHVEVELQVCPCPHVRVWAKLCRAARAVCPVPPKHPH